MKRREVLMASAAVVLAGCAGGDSGGGDTATTGETSSTETRTGGTVGSATRRTPRTPRTRPTESETATPTSATEAGTTVESANTTEPAPNGTPESPIPLPDAPGSPKRTPLTGEARVAFEDGGSRVVVAGTIVGQSQCRTAVLDSVRRTASGLVVTVATERDGTTSETCSLALVDIDYRFTIRVDRRPESVTVIHRGAAGERTVYAEGTNGNQ